MSYKLSGINPLAYMGVEPSTPPQMVVETRPPTINNTNFNLGTYWLIAAPPPTTDWELWILVDLSQGIATWKQLFPGSGSGGADQFDEDTGIAVPALGIILVKGGENINTVGDNVNKITINLNESIHLPNTSADGSQGVLFLGATGGVGGQTFLMNYGDQNTFVGTNAGNLTLLSGTANNNTGIGETSLTSLTTGVSNSAVGFQSLSGLTTGDDNSAIGVGSQGVLTTGSMNSSLGANSLISLVSGANNIAIGNQAGINYVGAESNNILIGSPGNAAESDTIRIGIEATQTSAFMAGVYNQSVGATNAQVWIDNTGKLGTMESGSSGNVIITTFTTSGTWTKNPDTKIAEFYIWNGGSGGASGTRGTGLGSNTFGGGGGSAGGFRYLKILSMFLGATESITVGSGGVGGAAQTVNNTAGNNGSLGGASGVASILMTTFPYFRVTTGGGNNSLFGLGSGVGGAQPVVMDGTSMLTQSAIAGGTGGPINAGDFGWFLTANTPPANVLPQANYVANFVGGGGGAGGNVGTTTGGHASDFVDIDDVTTLYAGAFGGGPNTDGSPGVAQPTSGAMVIGGGGGGGGGAQTAARAGNGGNGAVPGGGGGGGGHSVNGTNSGTGGTGGNGTVIVVEYL